MAAIEATPIMRRLSTKYDQSNEQIDDYFQRGMRGEEPDAAEFFALVQKRSTSQMAMEATIKLHEKPVKTVMTESH